MQTFTVQEFASTRRSVLDEAEGVLAPAVQAALDHFGTDGWFDDLLDVTVPGLFARIFREESGANQHPNLGDAEASLNAELRHMLGLLTKPEKETAERITRALATDVINAATIFAAEIDDADLELEWVDMHDDKVRETHRAANGQRIPIGGKFKVGDSEMSRPGDTTAPIEEWINCRCVVRPDVADREALAASAPAAKPSVIVALPHPDHPINSLGVKQPHTTLAYLGDNLDGDTMDQVRSETQKVASGMQPFTDKVSGRAKLGKDDADVLLTDGHGATAAHKQLISQPVIGAKHAEANSFPNYIPHTTLGYPGDDYSQPGDMGDIAYDRLAVWQGDDHTEYPMGDAMTAAAPPPDENGMIPWHGVLAPTGVYSGDKRRFADGSFRNRDLPLPLTWQKVSDEKHKQAYTVGRIDTIEPGTQRATGVLFSTPEADEFTGLMVDMGGKFGVSVDVDDATMQVDEDEQGITFTDARICSACAVNIPAFAEAYIAFGDWPDGDGTTETFGRGPGWATNPADTKRIHDYWTVPGQPGYEKIGWGTGGDFNRCRVEVGEEIGENSPDKTRFLNQICAQWHHDALGIWPSTHAKALGKHAGDTETPEGVSLVASAGWCPPSEWFTDPEFSAPTPLTLQKVGDRYRVYGHIAQWETCHIGFSGVCTTAIPSVTNYAYFNTGAMETDAGIVPVGQLTMGGGHADRNLGLRPALAHYDNVATAIADVHVGADDHGIWFNGLLREGITEQQRVEFLATPLSGDWRYVSAVGNKELIAACSVITPGLPLLRPQIGVHNGMQVSLVAAGMLIPPEVNMNDFNSSSNIFIGTTPTTLPGSWTTTVGTGTGQLVANPIPLQADADFVEKLAAALDDRSARKASASEVRAKLEAEREATAAALRERLNGE